VASNCTRSPSSGFPNCPRPQLPASHLSQLQFSTDCLQTLSWLTKPKSLCDWRSVGQSWYRAPSGAHDQIFIIVWPLRSCFSGAPSLTRVRLTMAAVPRSVVSRYIASAWTVQKTSLQQFFYCCVRVCCGHHMTATELLPSNKRVCRAVPYQRLSLLASQFCFEQICRNISRMPTNRIPRKRFNNHPIERKRERERSATKNGDRPIRLISRSEEIKGPKHYGWG
jgi:hypothetical protein